MNKEISSLYHYPQMTNMRKSAKQEENLTKKLEPIYFFKAN